MTHQLRITRTAPDTPCTDPAGHDLEDVLVRGAAVPTVSLCTRCGERWGVVVLPTLADEVAAGLHDEPHP